MLIIILILAIVLAGAGYAVWRTRRPQTPVEEKDAEQRRCLCPKCGQKVRYAARRSGREVSCPRCRHQWRLPATEAGIV
jgi:uncharacterized paraquat-inducible protein A